jgi:hypothetical protein
LLGTKGYVVVVVVVVVDYSFSMKFLVLVDSHGSGILI